MDHFMRNDVYSLICTLVVEDSANADVARGMHEVQGLVHILDGHLVRNELIQPEFTLEVTLNELRHLGAALNAAKSAAHPDTARHKLERRGLQYTARRCHSNDDGLAPALVASLQRSAHQIRASNALEGTANLGEKRRNKVENDGQFQSQFSATKCMVPSSILYGKRLKMIRTSHSHQRHPPRSSQ